MQKTLVQNIIINAMLKSKSSGPGGGSYKKIKNMFSDTKERNVVALDGGKFIIIKGFTMTAKICVGGLFLEVDNSFKLIRTESALDVLRRITRGRPSVADVKQFLREVPTVYATWNQTTYTIIGIGIGGSEDEDTTLHSTFKRRWRRNTGKEILNEKTGKMVPEIITEEEEITFLDYFNKILFGKYSDPSCKVRDLSQPLLKGISKNATGMMKSKPCWLPPEAVKPIGMSEKSRTPQLMRQLIKTTNLAPSERFESLNEVVNDLNSGEDAKKILSSWGLSLNPKRREQNALHLNQIALELDGKKQPAQINFESAELAGNQKEFQQFKFPLQQWRILKCQGSLNEKEEDQFLTAFSNALRPNGNTASMRIRTVSNERDILTIIKEAAESKVKLLILIQGLQRNERLYTAFKSGCTEYGMKSQSFLKKVMFNAPGRAPQPINTAVLNNVLKQIEIKCGGSPRNCPSLSKFIKTNKAMLLGLDAGGNAVMPRRDAVSWAALVASGIAGEPSVATVASSEYSNGEFCAANVQMFRSMFIAWGRKHKARPDNIIVFRDGLSSTSYNISLELEYNALVEAIKGISGEASKAPPKIIFIIVSRSGPRLAAMRNGKLDNPPLSVVIPPGTSEIEPSVLPEVRSSAAPGDKLGSFVLLNHKSRAGTANTTSYTIIKNTSNIPMSDLIMATRDSSWLYFSWAGAVRGPHVLQYAKTFSKMMTTLKDCPFTKTEAFERELMHLPWYI
eukprot:GHVL01015521.1.p1 GENE.GHVL01015521.1~~GHVL01015521.1.p1  ORF type:complete len:736 (+),score=80.29 GHVL01015521.1:525-2732(+)